MVSISRLSWDGRLWMKRRGGWSETPSDRLVDGIGMSCIRSGGRVAGFSEMFGKVWCGKIQICGADAMFCESIPHFTVKRPCERLCWALSGCGFEETSFDQRLVKGGRW